MLKSSPCDIVSSARPNTPSKANDLNGLRLSYVAAMNDPRSHTLPMQMVSCKHLPQISPVPKVMVTSSCGGSWPSIGAVPSQLTSRHVGDCDWMKRSWTAQASLLQSSAGTMRLPEPVSKTTEKVWTGEP